ncbi:MAG TPA: alpha/beta hydrolase [Caulobacteraceae bacterium]|nr:alpha/beta hydrolase [Caulobacteraceae bacterium]
MTAPVFSDRYWTSTDGLRLHARDYASASGEARLPVICLHGLTRNARDFEDLAPRLAAQGRRVLALDVRGRGGSAWDPVPARYVPAVYAGDVLALMDAAGIARALFIGTSMGGLITMVVAAVRPGAVAGACLNDIGPELAPEGLARIASYTGQGPKVADWAGAADYARFINQAAFPAYGPAGWDAFARRIFTEKDGVPVLDYDPDIAQAFKPPEGEPAPPTPDLWPLFAGLAFAPDKMERPLLLVRGALSDLLAPATADKMRDLAPHMAFAEVAHVGHAPMLDEPQALSAIDLWLKGAP